MGKSEVTSPYLSPVGVKIVNNPPTNFFPMEWDSKKLPLFHFVQVPPSIEGY